MSRRFSAILFLAFSTVAFAGPAMAGDKDLVFCLPGFPGTKIQAQPFVEKMLRHLEAKLSWPKGSMTGAYYPNEAEGLRQLDSLKPGIALVGPSVLTARYKSMGMKIIAKVEVQGRGDEVYSIVVKADGPGTIEKLAGKKLAGAVVTDPKFVHDVLLGKKLAVGQLSLVDEQKPLQALRAVARGQMDAAIVDKAVVDHLAELPFAKDLKVIFTASPVPAPAVVVFGEIVKDAKKLEEVLTGLCQQADGKELCKTLTISSIKAASESNYKSLFSAYGK
ncbi:MAG: phosphate/phosphite/phosphonate ABC transporter substrate-binding protein [Myxococcota bacterium]|nr:phosphate/phosphite/phosphonate ABC transporter substrate-binding protein [Myxococcota bacterium]